MSRRYAAALVVIGLLLALGTPILWLAAREDADFGLTPPAAVPAGGPRSPAPRMPGPSTVEQPEPVAHAPTSPAALRNNPVSVPTTSAKLVEAAPVVTPVRVLVPSLGIDASVRPVGVLPVSGALEIPDDVRVAGWYRYGAAPGASEGSSVLSAHVDSWQQGPGAFFPLSQIVEGAEITVELADGTTVAYAARGGQRYEKTLLPADLFARDGRHRLVLITCGGPFDAATRRYRDNVVVIAEPVDAP